LSRRDLGAALGQPHVLRAVSVALPSFLPDSWDASVSKWIPFYAGSQVWSTVSDPGLAVAAGLAVFLRSDA
jgi:hypothetical protein